MKRPKMMVLEVPPTMVQVPEAASQPIGSRAENTVMEASTSTEPSHTRATTQRLVR
jgi:hypothetical protein